MEINNMKNELEAIFSKYSDNIFVMAEGCSSYISLNELVEVTFEEYTYGKIVGNKPHENEFYNMDLLYGFTRWDYILWFGGSRPEIYLNTSGLLKFLANTPSSIASRINDEVIDMLMRQVKIKGVPLNSKIFTPQPDCLNQ